MALMNDPRNQGPRRGFGLPPEQDNTRFVPPGQMPEQMPEPAPEALEPAADDESAPGEETTDIMQAAETAPIDAQHIAEEAEEPPEVQYLEEILGVEIPKEMWAAVVKKIQEREMPKSAPKAQEAPAPEAAQESVFQRFGNPKNAY